jgi:hypothetical protein
MMRIDRVAPPADLLARGPCKVALQCEDFAPVNCQWNDDCHIKEGTEGRKLALLPTISEQRLVQTLRTPLVLDTLTSIPGMTPLEGYSSLHH